MWSAMSFGGQKFTLKSRVLPVVQLGRVGNQSKKQFQPGDNLFYCLILVKLNDYMDHFVQIGEHLCSISPHSCIIKMPRCLFFTFELLPQCNVKERMISGHFEVHHESILSTTKPTSLLILLPVPQ